MMTAYAFLPAYVKKLKELIELKNRFYSWKSAMESLDSPTLEDCERLIKQHSFGFPRFVMPDIDFELGFYRVRVIVNDTSEDICDPKTFSYPPAEFVKSFQRANAPGYPVFYGATDGKTAMEEIRLNGEGIKKGDRIFLSQWRIKKGTQYAVNYLTRKDIIQTHQGFRELTLQVYSEMERIFSKEEPFLGKAQRFLFEESASLFFTGSYAASGTIGHQILYDTPEVNGIRINGIAYPSCANDFRGVNFAFHPAFVDSALEMVSVRLVTFEEFTDDGANTTGDYNGLIENGRIKWTCYKSHLMVDELETNVYLSEDCRQEDVYGSTIVFNDGRKIQLKDYCQQKARSIDLSKMKVTNETEHYYISEKEMAYVLKLTFSAGIAVLEVADRFIPILEIHVIVPLKLKVEQVNVKKILKKL